MKKTINKNRGKSQNYFSPGSSFTLVLQAITHVEKAITFAFPYLIGDTCRG